MNKKTIRANFKWLVYGVLAVAIGYSAFLIALEGSTEAPLQESCQDWVFHLCYAETLDAVGCSGGNYTSYPFTVHLGAAMANEATGCSFNFLLSVLIGFLFFILALILFERDGVIAFSLFFFIVPAFLMIVFNLAGLLKDPFTWISMVWCGAIPFLVAITLFLTLFFYTKKIGFWPRLALAGLLVLVHSFGWILVLFFIACHVLTALPVLFNVKMPELKPFEWAIYLIGAYGVATFLVVSVMPAGAYGVFADGLRIMYVFYFFLAVAIATWLRELFKWITI